MSFPPRVSHLNHYEISKLVFDPSMLRDSGNFNKGRNQQEHYPDADDEFPPNMPDLLGPQFQTTCFLDADRAGEQLTRRL